LDILGYKKIFVIPNLYYDKTNQAVIEDNLINGEAKKKAQEALNKLRNNESFEEVAKTYSDDINKDKNASQENFLRGELAKDIEDELFSMKEGTYTDIITLPDSYAIFKLLKKDENKGVLTTQRIVIKLKTLDNLITEQKQKAQIKIYAY
jgi:parvulin-like peptidyl-prolyl isomerase